GIEIKTHNGAVSADRNLRERRNLNGHISVVRKRGSTSAWIRCFPVDTKCIRPSFKKVILQILCSYADILGEIGPITSGYRKRGTGHSLPVGTEHFGGEVGMVAAHSQYGYGSCSLDIPGRGKL